MLLRVRCVLSLRASRVAHTTRRRARFVVAELAIALTLLMAGGLLLRSLSSLLGTSPGFQSEGVALLQVFVRLPNSTEGERAAYVQRILDAMRTVPGVQAAGAASVIPFLNTTSGVSVPVGIEGRPAPAAGEEPSAFVNIATPGYFSAMRIPVIEGRTFDEHDNASRTPVAVVSHAFARRYWRERSAVGQFVQVTLRETTVRAEIVGLVGDVRYDALDRSANQELFLPHAQAPGNGMTFVVRTPSDPAQMLEALQSRLHAVAPNQPVYRTATLSALVGDSVSDRRFMLSLVLAFAVLAVSLAAIGVYGVMTVMSTQRTREYGLRLALGARRGEILRMVLREGLRITSMGLAIGVAGAVVSGQACKGSVAGTVIRSCVARAIGRIAIPGVAAGVAAGIVLQFRMAAMLYGIDAPDPLSLATGAASASLILVAATGVPARWACRTQPGALLLGGS